jgi:hypothetical protein
MTGRPDPWRALRVGSVLVAGLALSLSPAQAAPADNLAALWQTLGSCAKIGAVPAPSLGSEVTVLFSLKRDGSLLGQPRITHSRLVGDQADQQAFMAAALTAVAKCLPVPITDGLGGAIAGRPLRLRLTSRKPERAI